MAVDSLDKDIAYVNSLLSQFSLEHPFPFKNGPASSLTTVDRLDCDKAVRILLSLLSWKQKEGSFRSESEERIRRLTDELKARELVLASSEERLVSAQNESRTLLRELREANQKAAAAEATASGTKEKLARLQTAFLHKEKQFTHEIRKRDLAYEKLKEQLQGSMAMPALVVDSKHVFITKRTVDRVVSDILGTSKVLDVPNAPKDITLCRLNQVEQDNLQLRELISSTLQNLHQMKNLILADCIDQEHDQKIEVSIGGLPADWVFERVKEDIEDSLNAINNRVHQTCIFERYEYDAERSVEF